MMKGRLMLIGVVLYALVSACLLLGYISIQLAGEGAVNNVAGEGPRAGQVPCPEGTTMGVLSNKPASFFRDLQRRVDQGNETERCLRYGSVYNSSRHRRIFFGALIADEPWEILEAVAAEVYGIYEAVVLVESNRTQNQTPRPFRHLNHTSVIRDLFGVEHVQIRSFVEEPVVGRKSLKGLEREHACRAEIIEGWKDLGMQTEDVGLLADMDETFTRDFTRAVQVCDGLTSLHYEQHRCQHQHVKLVASSRVFESSPECITSGRSWFHPDMIIGHCVDGIGPHPTAPREGSYGRAPTFGSRCGDWSYEQNATMLYAWDASDFRRTCGGVTPKNLQANHSSYTAHHFHNFFYNFTAARFKYGTYGHPMKNADTTRAPDMNNDMKMTYNCLMGLPDEQGQKWKRVLGGFNNSDEMQPFLPIYFHDAEYRSRRHAHAKRMILEDEAMIDALTNASATGRRPLR